MKLLNFKKVNYNHQLFLIIAIVFICQQSIAQTGFFSKKNKRNQYSTVGIGGGASHYFGDLSPYSYFYYGLITNVRWNATINYTKQLTPGIATRVGFTWARIAGDDYAFSKRNLDKFWRSYLRNLHFRNDIKEFTITGLFDLTYQENKGVQNRPTLRPYLFAGIGFYGHNPQARGVDISTDAILGTQPKLSKQPWENLYDKRTSGQGISSAYPKVYSRVQPVFPVGIGLKIKVNKKMDLGIESGLRITPFDYLDDVGNTLYVDPIILAGNGSVEFANRAGENYASTGNSRVEEFKNIISSKLSALISSTTTPSTNGLAIWGYNNGAQRGTKKWDSYLVTQFTLTYVINDKNQIQCPVIK